MKNNDIALILVLIIFSILSYFFPYQRIDVDGIQKLPIVLLMWSFLINIFQARYIKNNTNNLWNFILSSLAFITFMSMAILIILGLKNIISLSFINCILCSILPILINFIFILCIKYGNNKKRSNT